MYWTGVSPLRVLKADQLAFYCFYGTSAVRAIYKKVVGKRLILPRYAGRHVAEQDEGNRVLTAALLGDKPYLCGRYGSNELFCATMGTFMQQGVIDGIPAVKREDIAQKCANSGLFPDTPDTLMRFHELIADAGRETDLYGVYRMVMEEYYIRRYMRAGVPLTHLSMLDFWRYEKPYTSALKGQKVLVVHPLAEQIERQYARREKLFANPEVLPAFELLTLPAVQTIAGERDPRFATWFDGLDYMAEQASRMDYEVALLGCGAYGMPLAARLKREGKKVIYMGGVLQLLFGIKGKRWEDTPAVTALYNEHWVRPDEKTLPANYRSVENGCYW